jgi:hypothetical protein
LIFHLAAFTFRIENFLNLFILLLLLFAIDRSKCGKNENALNDWHKSVNKLLKISIKSCRITCAFITNIRCSTRNIFNQKKKKIHVYAADWYVGRFFPALFFLSLSLLLAFFDEQCDAHYACKCMYRIQKGRQYCFQISSRL